MTGLACAIREHSNLVMRGSALVLRLAYNGDSSRQPWISAGLCTTSFSKELACSERVVRRIGLKTKQNTSGAPRINRLFRNLYIGGPKEAKRMGYVQKINLYMDLSWVEMCSPKIHILES